MANNNKGTSKIGLGAAGFAALAAAAAGAYYFYGSPAATRHRNKMKSWMVKAKGDVMERMENLKEVTEESYQEAVDQVMRNYKKMKHIKPAEVVALGRELKSSWDRINKLMGTAPQSKTRRKPLAAKKVTTKKK